MEEASSVFPIIVRPSFLEWRSVFEAGAVWTLAHEGHGTGGVEDWRQERRRRRSMNVCSHGGVWGSPAGPGKLKTRRFGMK